jgi:hypothetical protein
MLQLTQPHRQKRLPAIFITHSAKLSALTCLTNVEHCIDGAAHVISRGRYEQRRPGWTPSASVAARWKQSVHACRHGDNRNTYCSTHCRVRTIERTWTTTKYSSHVACQRCNKPETCCRVASAASLPLATPLADNASAATLLLCSLLISAMMVYRQFWGWKTFRLNSRPCLISALNQYCTSITNSW